MLFIVHFSPTVYFVLNLVNLGSDTQQFRSNYDYSHPIIENRLSGEGGFGGGVRKMREEGGERLSVSWDSPKRLTFPYHI